MYSGSSSSRTTANTAYYDPQSKCIRLPADDINKGIRSILEGSIIEMDEPSFELGNSMLLGEIYEIGKSVSDILFICGGCWKLYLIRILY